MTDTEPPDPWVKALADQAKILDRVEKLAKTNRRQRWLIIALGVIVAALVVFGIVGAVGLHRLNDTTADVRRQNDELRDNTERDAAARAAIALDACRTRNGAAAGTRGFQATFYDALTRLFPTPGGQEFVAHLRAEAPIPQPEAQDIDCNASGALDPGDYPET